MALPLGPVDAESRPQDVDGGSALVPLDLRIGLDGTVGDANLSNETKLERFDG